MPNRKKQNRKSRRQRYQRPLAFTGKSRPGWTMSGLSQYQQAIRVLLASVPIIIGDVPVALLSVFDLAFNLYKYSISKQDYYAGAYCQFGITAGCLVRQSPLLAADGGKFSFPGHPISIKHISITVRATVAAAAYIGRWAAVFIPFLELHDKEHYKTMIADLTFAEVASMPYARTGLTSQPIRLTYRMRDKTAYCARPRELSEVIGLTIIAWDNYSKDNPTVKPTNSQFNCEVELRSGFKPHVIFGPQHRVTYEPDVFKPLSLTDGTKELTILEKDGPRFLTDIDWSRELLDRMAIE